MNLAFLGCGNVARLHSRTLARLDRSVRRFYASREATKAAAFRETLDGAGSFEGYDAAIESPEIDVVLVATPPALHLDLTLQALRAGKHVIVEKPPFLSASDFEQVEAARQKSGRQVLVAENYYYKPLADTLRELLRQEVVGEVLFVHVNALKRQTTGDWRDEPTLAGRGALFEGGIHWICLLNHLGWNVAQTRALRPGTERDALERSLLVALQYAEGPVGTLYYSWDVPSLFRGLRLSKIYGRQGSITFESNGVIVIVRGKKRRLTFPNLRDVAGYRPMFRDFLDALRSSRPARYTLEMARQDLQLVERIYQSLQAG